MNHFTATQILDKAREGNRYPMHIINQALELTGDIDDGNNSEDAYVAYCKKAKEVFGEFAWTSNSSNI